MERRFASSHWTDEPRTSRWTGAAITAQLSRKKTCIVTDATFVSPWRGRQRKAGAVGSTPTKFNGRWSLHRVRLLGGISLVVMRTVDIAAVGAMFLDCDFSKMTIVWSHLN